MEKAVVDTKEVVVETGDLAFPHPMQIDRYDQSNRIDF
jgi:hypothetical protein